MKNLKEILSIITAIVVFKFSEPVLRTFVDPTMAAFDGSIFQIIIFAIASFLVYQFLTWVTVSILWPAIKNYFTSNFTNDFNQLTSWQKVKTSLFVYFSLFLLFVLLSRVL